jgi:DNA-binding transcriptional regulator of glucitol operon
VLRTVLTPKWLVMHAVSVIAALVMVRLGLWQWHVAHSHNDSFRNRAYAVQWVLFAIFTLAMEVRVSRDAIRTKVNAGVAAAADEVPSAVLQTYVAPPPPAETDQARLAYNSYLAGLGSPAADAPMHVDSEAR